MKFLVFLFVFVAAVSADVSHIVNPDAHAPILKQGLNVDALPSGSYQWNFETGNGIVAQEQGSLKQLDKDEQGQSAIGSAQWSAPDGQRIELTYEADERGYRPQGSHIPAIPPAILRALEWIEKNPPPPETKKTQKF